MWNAKAVESVLRQAVDSDTIPGAAATVAARGKVILEAAFSQGGALQFDSICRIASMTKAITSVAAMQLIERGALRLDDLAATYLPALAHPVVLEGFRRDTGEPVQRPAARPITVRQLLTHTSGFSYEFFNPLIRDWMLSGKIPSIRAGGDGFLQAPLVADPGTRWEYGISTDWLGRLIEAVSGISLDEYFRRHILEPLGMADTHFNVPANKEHRRAPLYRRQQDGSLAEVPRAPSRPVSFFGGGGGLQSTAADYLKFLCMILGHGDFHGFRILRPESVALMCTNQIGPLAAGRMASSIPNESEDVDLQPGVVNGFGLGLLVHAQPVAGGRSAGSLSWAGIANTYYWLDPVRNICGVLLMQYQPFFDRDAVALYQAFEHAVYTM